MNKSSVLVAMSGGVDSSTAAYLLKEKGYTVRGITMLIVDDDSARSTVEDAGRVCDYLGVEHIVVDLSKEFKDKVIDYFIKEYLRGRTPNPCVECNKHFKFSLLYDKARDLGFAFFATGHFARIERDRSSNYLLKKGQDTKKDQSYFLYPINRDYLGRIIFPLGDHSKEDAFNIARSNNIPFSNKGPSQDLCFVTQDNCRDFIKSNIEDLKTGEIVDREGNILGQHAGIPFYTIGQRSGLGISGPCALYVIDIDHENNRVIVGEKDGLKSIGLIASNLNIFNSDLRGNISAKIRYKHPPAECRMCRIDNGRLTVMFKEDQEAITPGQSVVLYQDDVVLGGGVIEEVIR
ncbi:MAG: tRNA 2-thiouridine(34) synthase MnmA [Candidatus Kaelpia aquatica]|nr:tRNA 2-thiouridine(34) synthase MnmA [Candidatus Kaelpia aquatica]